MNAKKKTRSRGEQTAINGATAAYKSAQADVLRLRAEMAMAQAAVSEAKALVLNKRSELDEANAARKKAKMTLDALRA
jgi:multidrug resistance efflux pump